LLYVTNLLGQGYDFEELFTSIDFSAESVKAVPRNPGIVSILQSSSTKSRNSLNLAKQFHEILGLHDVGLLYVTNLLGQRYDFEELFTATDFSAASNKAAPQNPHCE
jgi:hypothetical protein